MHNSERLTRGKELCTLLMNPQDVERLGLEDAHRVVVSSRVGRIDLPLERSDTMMPGVVSIPHGYGHNRHGSKLPVAESRAGESINDLTDDLVIDQLTGNAAFSGLHVTVYSARDMEKEFD